MSSLVQLSTALRTAARANERRPVRRRGLQQKDLRSAVSGVRGEIRFNAPLRDFTSFRIGGPADVLVSPADEEALARLVRQARAAQCPIFVIGGSNLLVRDRGIRGLVVSLAKLKTITDEGAGILYAQGGAGMPTLIRHAVSRSLSGLEWAAGIPGTVAGCVVMNAGTRLGEMSSAVTAVRIVNPKGQVVDYPATKIHFGYRCTRMPRGIVAGVWLQLKPATRAGVDKVVKEYLRYRKETQPLTIPNAGCVFKNPEKHAAGRLIEEAGMKGVRIGDAQVSEKHANFVVNLGAARAADVIALIKKVKRAVEDRTGVTLQLELKIVGEP